MQTFKRSLDKEWQRRSDAITHNPQTVIDETLLLLPELSEDMQQAQAHLVLSLAYYTLVIADESLSHAQRGNELVKEQTEPWLFHSLALAQANALDIAGNAEPGLMLAQNAIQWAEVNQEYDLLVDAHSTYGLLELTLGGYDDALEHLLEAYDMAQKFDTASTPGHIASLIALVYEYRGEDRLTVPYFEESLEYYRSIDDRINISNSLYGLGRALRNLGDVEKGLALLEESADISRELNDEQGLAYTQKELAETYLRLQQYSRAKMLFERAVESFAEANNPFMQFGSYYGLAEIAILQADWEAAESYLRQAESFLTGNSMRAQKIDLDRKLAQVLAGQQKFSQAFTLLMQSYHAREVFLREQNSQRLQTLQTQFEVAQKEAENLQLQQQNALQQQQLDSAQQRRYLFIVVASLLALVCVLLILLYRNSLQHRKRLEQLANTDELTGLSTRRFAYEQLNQQIDLANRHHMPIAVAMADLDFFKKINDRYGHQVGDQVLAEFGALARAAFRHTDVLGRVGGEEFLFAFPHTKQSEAMVQLERFREKVSRIPERIGLSELSVTISVGVVEHSSGMNMQTMFSCADEALYQAKESGRNRIVGRDCKEA